MSLFEKYGHIATANLVIKLKITNEEEYLIRRNKVANALVDIKKLFFSEDPEENTKVRLWEAMGTACLLWEIDNNLLPI